MRRSEMSKKKTEETMDSWKEDPGCVKLRGNDIDPGDFAKIMGAFSRVSSADCGVALDATGAPIVDANGDRVLMVAVAVPTNVEYDGP
jgi:hypothetical protein